MTVCQLSILEKFLSRSDVQPNCWHFKNNYRGTWIVRKENAQGTDLMIISLLFYWQTRVSKKYKETQDIKQDIRMRDIICINFLCILCLFYTDILESWKKHLRNFRIKLNKLESRTLIEFINSLIWFVHTRFIDVAKSRVWFSMILSFP